MSILTNSPSPNKPNPDWSFQVKVGRGRADTGAHHRAIDVATKLFDAGRWDGRGLLIVHDVYDVHAKMQLGLPVADADFEFSEDSMYPRPAQEPTDAVEIDGRAYCVTDRLSISELPARVAEVWRKLDVVAHVEVRRPRGRCSYIARQYADGSYSRPWRGQLTFAN